MARILPARISSACPATRITPRRAHSSRSSVASWRTFLVLRMSATPCLYRTSPITLPRPLSPARVPNGHPASPVPDGRSTLLSGGLGSLAWDEVGGGVGVGALQFEDDGGVG